MDLEKSRKGIEEKFFEISQKVVNEQGYVLYDLEYITGTSTLRLFIMDPATKTAVIEDCIKVDRAMTDDLQADWVPDSLVLEVSSPGMFRQLKKRPHFESAVGDVVSVVLSEDLAPEVLESLPKKMKGKKFRGILKTVSDDKIIINMDELDVPLLFSKIKKAQLDPDY